MPRGVKRASILKPATQFCALSGKSATKIFFRSNVFMNTYLLVRWFVTFRLSMEDGFFGAVGEVREFAEGAGALLQAGKIQIVGEKPNFKTTVLSNYSPKLILLFATLNLSTSTCILL